MALAAVPRVEKPELGVRRARGSRNVVWALGLLAVGGCTTTTVIRPTELSQLDGYDARQPASAEREVQALSGSKVAFRPDSKLYLDLPGDVVGGRFESIHVRDGVFDGVTPLGYRILTPVNTLTGARVTQPNPGRTTAALVAAGVGLFAVMLGGALVLLDQGHTQTVNGRALRIRGKVVSTPLALASGWRGDDARPDAASLSPGARAALAAFWTDAARAEHASIPAFSRLALTLVALGAPADLVEAAHRAALQEIEHARLSFALAEAYAGRSIAPGSMRALARARAVTASSLDELARESLLEGCLFEGLAAAVARAALASAQDQAVSRALAIIARDESSHAELAWRILAWCCERGGSALRRNLQGLGAAFPIIRAPREAAAGIEAELTAHGWVAPVRWNELSAETGAKTAARLDALTRRS
jgi:hypothetical protein